MLKNFYFDTSIWLDLIEERDEPNLPKSELAHKLLNKITRNSDKILYSDVILFELNVLGYSSYEVNDLFESIRPLLIFVESTEKQMRKAKDLALKRNVPKRDALHALIARDNKAILVTLDKHFQKLLDVIKSGRPQDFI